MGGVNEDDYKTIRVCVHKRCFSKSTFTHYLFCFSCLKILLLVVFVIRYVDEFPQYQFIPPTPAIVIHVYVCMFILLRIVSEYHAVR